MSGATTSVEPTLEARFGGWIQTASGGRFYPLDPRSNEIKVEDIAHGLANLCRFAGQTSVFYSVAQHSVYVSRVCDPADALWGLLHDATEALGLVDIPRPVKRAPEMEGYRKLERRLELAIAERFGLPADVPESVKRADVILLATERRDLMKAPPAPWDALENIAPLEQRILPWAPDYARACFLRRFDELIRGAES